MNHKRLFLAILASLIFLNGNSAAQAASVELVLDKTEYRSGEQITAAVKFDGNIFVWPVGHWSVQKREQDGWVIIEEAGCKSFLSCEELYDAGSLHEATGLPECGFISCERPMWYKIDRLHSYARWAWDQKYVADQRTVECWRVIMKDEGESDKIACLVFQPVLPGRYKIKFSYALEIDEQDPFEKKAVSVSSVEKEFVISE